MELSVEQRRALALAAARQRAESGTPAPEAQADEPQTVMGYIMNESWPAKAIKGAIDAAALPGDVYAGRTDPMSQEGLDRTTNLALSALPTNPMVRSGDAAWTGVKNALVPAKNTRVPTAEELKGAATAGYDAVRDMGVEYSSDAVRTAAATIKRTLEQDGILGNLAPKTHRIIDELADPPEGSVATSAGIEAARRALGHAGKDFANPTEQLAASTVIDGLDEFVTRAAPESVVAGPASAAGKALTDARGNYAAAKRSERLAGEDNYGSVEGRATLNAASANSGANLDNAIRQQAKSVLLNPKARSGFTTEELADLARVAGGSTATNVLRKVGNLLGGGGGLGAGVTAGLGAGAGAATGSMAATVAGAALPIVGAAAKAGENALARRSLHAIDEKTRMRSPLYDQLLSEATKAKNPERYAAILRILALAEGPQEEGM